MVMGAKGEEGAQRRSLRLSGAFTKIALSQQKQPGTDTGQVSK
jgi:hypothetical protein